MRYSINTCRMHPSLLELVFLDKSAYIELTVHVTTLHLSKYQCMRYNIAFNFRHLNYDISCISVWVHFVWDTLCFLYLDICFLPQVWELFSHNFIRYILDSFLSLFLWESYKVNVGALSVVSKVP